MDEILEIVPNTIKLLLLYFTGWVSVLFVLLMVFLIILTLTLIISDHTQKLYLKDEQIRAGQLEIEPLDIRLPWTPWILIPILPQVRTTRPIFFISFFIFLLWVMNRYNLLLYINLFSDKFILGRKTGIQYIHQKWRLEYDYYFHKVGIIYLFKINNTIKFDYKNRESTLSIQNLTLHYIQIRIFSPNPTSFTIIPNICNNINNIISLVSIEPCTTTEVIITLNLDFKMDFYSLDKNRKFTIFYYDVEELFKNDIDWHKLSINYLGINQIYIDYNKQSDIYQIVEQEKSKEFMGRVQIISQASPIKLKYVFK